MKLNDLLTLSPTLLRGMYQAHKKHITTGQKVFNAKDISLDAWFKNEQTGETIRMCFNELPEEIRQGIHDYTTRLCSEKLLIETAIEQSTTTTV